MSQISITKVNYNGWPHCLCMENGLIRLIITTDVGPRIIYCSFNERENLFHQNREQQGLMDDAEWHIYGGHRLWHSPQVGYRPNQPDNVPVQWNILEGERLSLTSSMEQETRVQKVIEIEMAQEEPSVVVRHRIYNRGVWPVKLAPWALTVMREGGMEVFPVPQEDTRFLPNYAISFWPWTKPNDHRFTLGDRYMFLRQDESDERWFKIGYRNTEGWGAYFRDNAMFVKLYDEKKNCEYPDYGSTFETYTDQFFIELESLGPLEEIEPGSYVEHTEKWYLFDQIEAPQSEEDMDQKILPLIRRVQEKGENE